MVKMSAVSEASVQILNQFQILHSEGSKNPLQCNV